MVVVTVGLGVFVAYLLWCCFAVTMLETVGKQRSSRGIESSRFSYLRPDGPDNLYPRNSRSRDPAFDNLNRPLA
jgi:hypothetical protein